MLHRFTQWLEKHTRYVRIMDWICIAVVVLDVLAGLLLAGYGIWELASFPRTLL